MEKLNKKEYEIIYKNEQITVLLSDEEVHLIDKALGGILDKSYYLPYKNSYIDIENITDIKRMF